MICRWTADITPIATHHLLRYSSSSLYRQSRIQSFSNVGLPRASASALQVLGDGGSHGQEAGGGGLHRVHTAYGSQANRFQVIQYRKSTTYVGQVRSEKGRVGGSTIYMHLHPSLSPQGPDSPNRFENLKSNGVFPKLLRKLEKADIGLVPTFAFLGQAALIGLFTGLSIITFKTLIR